MSLWPEDMEVGPIREWPGEPTRVRKSASFWKPGKWVDDKWKPQERVPLTQTLGDLKREIRELRAKDAELLVAIPPEKFRQDGRPRADATATHPGVILSFEIPKVGRVSYPCDTYTRWEDNLRAIVLALEALRLVNRHGVVKHGEQYRGFLAIEATAAPAGFATVDDAVRWLRRLISASPDELLTWGPRDLLRRAQRETHPDHGGDAATFQRVSLAEQKLRSEGLL
jgi:hypothetical protein